eukprot:758990-Pyramimonas_sp.AAC.1
MSRIIAFTRGAWYHWDTSGSEPQWARRYLDASLVSVWGGLGGLVDASSLPRSPPAPFDTQP